MKRRAAALLAALVLGSIARPSIADELRADSTRSQVTFSPADADSTDEGDEPPEDQDPERDYESEREDSLASGSVEMGYAFAQRAGSSLRRRRLLQVREPALEARVRDGADDPLAGAALGTRVPGGWLAVGKLAPAWGRGLMLGSPLDPWRTGFIGPPRARSRSGGGDGIEYRSRALPFDLVARRVRSMALAGAAIGDRSRGAGVTVRRDASRARTGFLSAWTSRSRTSSELALDQRGRWRAETVVETPRTPHWALAARLGHTAFDGAVPSRTLLPALALGARVHTSAAPISFALATSLWRFRAAATGARAALEVHADLPQHDRIVGGWEERHGLRRVTRAPSSCDCGGRADGFRQGAWLEWRGGPPGFVTTARQEIWGARSGLRQVTRRAASAGVTAALVPGVELGIAATVYRSRSGEPQYLSEEESDRRVLRALSGAGRRSRVQLMFPAAGGRVRAALTLSSASGHETPPQWTLDWTARTRTR